LAYYEGQRDSRAKKSQAKNQQKTRKSDSVCEPFCDDKLKQTSSNQAFDANFFEAKTTEENASAYAGLHLKLPYPVLNETRDYKDILKVLENKQLNLNTMLKQTLQSLNNLHTTILNKEDIENRKVRLKNLEENIKVQLTRLVRQIDFINYKLEISKLAASIHKYENLENVNIFFIKKKFYFIEIIILLICLNRMKLTRKSLND